MTQIRDSYISLDINLGKQWGHGEEIRGDHSVNGKSADVGRMLASYAADHRELELIIIHSFFWLKYIAGDWSEGEVQEAIEEHLDVYDLMEET